MDRSLFDPWRDGSQRRGTHRLEYPFESCVTTRESARASEACMTTSEIEREREWEREREEEGVLPEVWDLGFRGEARAEPRACRATPQDGVGSHASG